VQEKAQAKDGEDASAQLFGDLRVLCGEPKEVIAQRINEATKVMRRDIFAVADIMDEEEGVPLFAEFAPEDWALCTLRFELWALVHSFKRDVKDPDIKGMAVDHLGFYYNKYFKRMLSAKAFGVETLEEVLALVRNTVVVDARSKTIVCPLLEADIESFSIFVKLTEADRIHRNMRLGSGDKSAGLSFSRPAGPMMSLVPAATPTTVPYNELLKEKLKGFMVAVLQPGAAGVSPHTLHPALRLPSIPQVRPQMPMQNPIQTGIASGLLAKAQELAARMKEGAQSSAPLPVGMQIGLQNASKLALSMSQQP